MITNKKNVCVDFDGVLNSYDGWKGEDVLFEPRQGIEKFLQELSRKFNVYVYTTRNAQDVSRWFQKYDLMKFINGIGDTKVPAIAYVDDRAIPFLGSFDSILSQLVDNEFKTFWEMEPGEDFKEIDKVVNQKNTSANILKGFLETLLPKSDLNPKEYGKYIGVQMALGLIIGEVPSFLPEPKNYKDQKFTDKQIEVGQRLHEIEKKDKENARDFNRLIEAGLTASQIMESLDTGLTLKQQLELIIKKESHTHGFTFDQKLEQKQLITEIQEENKQANESVIVNKNIPIEEIASINQQVYKIQAEDNIEPTYAIAGVDTAKGKSKTVKQSVKKTKK